MVVFRISAAQLANLHLVPAACLVVRPFLRGVEAYARHPAALDGVRICLQPLQPRGGHFDLVRQQDLREALAQRVVAQ